MGQKKLPVYNISQFEHHGQETDFYANMLSVHLNRNTFVKLPHKHDFYLVILFIAGTGIHEIDFNVYQVKPGDIFILSPGQMHCWKFSEDIEAFVLFHTREFYDLNFNAKKVKDFPFFCSSYNSPYIHLEHELYEKAEKMFEEVIEEYNQHYLLKYQKICSLIDLLYIALTRVYLPKEQIRTQNHTYLGKLGKLEDLIDVNFRKIKSPKEYAAMMHMSEKHLNKICKESLNKTTTELIIQRTMLEAKRMLVHAKLNVSEVSLELGYLDVSYFSRFFKKKCGVTPLDFIKRYREQYTY